MRKSAEALAPAFNLVPLDFSNTPPVERKAIETKKKEKPAKSTENSATAAGPTIKDSATANKPESSEAKPVKKKGKQEATAEKDGKKKTTSSANATSTATEDAGSPIPSMIDLRVGHIVEGKCAHRCLRLTFTVQQSKSTLTRMAYTLKQVVNVCLKSSGSFDVL